MYGCGASSTRDPTRRSFQRPASRSTPAADAQCTRAHGVPLPNPVDGHITLIPTSGIDPGSRQFEVATQACASLAPSTAPQGAGTAIDPTVATGSTARAALWRAFDAWLDQRAGERRFSGAVLVAHNGSPILAAGYGMADRAGAIANTPQTKFRIASIGKLFTAVAIAQLAEQHKLGFNDTVGRYLTGLHPRSQTTSRSHSCSR
jgi:CubicO group peptidase (beta-lactamase class C family)